MRVVVERWKFYDGRRIYRLAESDGSLCMRWLPGEVSEGPLDCGGFEQRSDARAFCLGVDYERALHGLLEVSVDDIQRERRNLDVWCQADQESSPDELEADAQLDMATLWRAVEAVSDVQIDRRRVA